MSRDCEWETVDITIDTLEKFTETYHECCWRVKKINLYNNLAKCYLCSDQIQVHDNLSIVFCPLHSDEEDKDNNIEICQTCFCSVDWRVSDAVKQLILYIESLLVSQNLTVNPCDHVFYQIFLQYISWSGIFIVDKTRNLLSMKQYSDKKPPILVEEDIININWAILNKTYVERHFIPEDFNLKGCICGRVHQNSFDECCQQCSYYGYNGYKILSLMNPQPIKNSSYKCPICYENRNTIAFGCKHKICTKCFEKMRIQWIHDKYGRLAFEKIYPVDDEDDNVDVFLSCPLCRDPYLLFSGKSIESHWQNMQKLKRELYLAISIGRFPSISMIDRCRIRSHLLMREINNPISHFPNIFENVKHI
jgi:hypothetical protein